MTGRGALALVMAWLGVPLGAAPPPLVPPAVPSGFTLVDRVVAIVDDDPVLASDVERVIDLGLVPAKPGESPAALRRRALGELIEQRLRAHEIDRYGFAEVPVDAVDAEVERVRSRFPGAAELTARLAALGLDEKGLRQLLARQLMVLAFLEERLGPRVFVGLEEIRQYYESTLTPALTARGEPAPPLDEVREQIRAVLKEQRLNEEIARWTAELRRQADVVDLLDQAPLPPR